MSGGISLQVVDEDRVFPFQIEGEAVRGRLVRLGAAVDEILSAHNYPDPVANLLGETIWRVYNASSVQALRD